MMKSNQRYDFFIFLAYLIGNNVKSAKKVMHHYLEDADKEQLFEIESSTNKNLEDDMIVYKGRNFEIFFNKLLLIETDENKKNDLLELKDELRKNIKINKLGIFSPRLN